MIHHGSAELDREAISLLRTAAAEMLICADADPDVASAARKRGQSKGWMAQADSIEQGASRPNQTVQVSQVKRLLSLEILLAGVVCLHSSNTHGTSYLVSAPRHLTRAPRVPGSAAVGDAVAGAVADTVADAVAGEMGGAVAGQ